jgi:hypothetical protein
MITAVANNETPKKTVVVTGDITIDWNLARSRGPEVKGPAWLSDVCAHVSWQHGAAALLANIIKAVAEPAGFTVLQPQVPVKAPGAPAPQLQPEDPAYHHSYASWMLYPYSTDPADKKSPMSWRIHEFLGINPSSQKGAPADWAKVQGDDADAQLVVLDDAALGFNRLETLWPAAITTQGRSPWIIVKVARIGDGSLWTKLMEHKDRLIVVINVNDLRHKEAQISRELSWERTAQDLAWEIAFNPAFSDLAHCAHVVVSFNAAGALMFSRREPGFPPGCRLIFDPSVIEGVWESSREGRMRGYTSCLTAAIAREILQASGNPNIERGVQGGLTALRALHCEGYGQRGTTARDVKLEFPLQAVLRAMEEGSNTLPFSSVNVRLPGLIRKGGSVGGIARPWTILEEAYPGAALAKAVEAFSVGVEKALASAPIGKFGKLVTVDRQEIESLRTIGGLVSEYADLERPRRPLSIAVFGPPGSGKSFGIKQLALSLRPGEIEIREFNMSQFQSTAELISALHQVRDIGLNHKLPLVFWDEFDSSMGTTPFGWLRHFLAPMQDGKFQEGDLDHPIGRAIFVFAGGTSHRYQEFGQSKDEKERQLLKELKVPDFISRLKGFLNVLGPNPIHSEGRDPFYVLRRAILLRSMLNDVPGIMKGKTPQIDSGVLNAFLTTREYRHGARSMESIIAASRLSGKNKFERSSLPPEDQLELHVEAKDFIARVHRLELKGEILERLAKAAHELFCEKLRAKGWQSGAVLDEPNKRHPNLKDYEQLTEEDRQQNRDQVQDIPAKLAYAGCDMIPDRTGTMPREFPAAILEELASREHTRWIRLKIAAGWTYGKDRNDQLKLHPCLLPWSEEDRANHAEYADAIGPVILPESEKDKDRHAVRDIPEVLAKAGFKVVWPNEN